ncbi:MAG TPA: histidine kinase dimerization/phospho-acceptor domain-containing protein [Gemmatimonadaceae bacterium]|nr:histidine kinase dimerization/phospho-acceptor domain-containing protein [Gemmatimonadaceae bacterium]
MNGAMVDFENSGSRAGSGRTSSPPAGADDELRALRREAARIQHELNNPLAALLAEVQLLQEETGDPGTADAAQRIVELARRVIRTVRELDVLRGDEGTP